MTKCKKTGVGSKCTFSTFQYMFTWNQLDYIWIIPKKLSIHIWNIFPYLEYISLPPIAKINNLQPKTYYCKMLICNNEPILPGNCIKYIR